jgi:hypothetical protein
LSNLRICSWKRLTSIKKEEQKSRVKLKIYLGQLLIVALLLTGCSMSYTTATIIEPGMTSAVVDGNPVDKVKVYSREDSQLFAYGTLNNALEGTQIRFAWKYLTEPQIIHEVGVTSEGESGVYVFSTLVNDGPWPIGDYSVEIFIDDRHEPDAIAEFSIK